MCVGLFVSVLLFSEDARRAPSLDAAAALLVPAEPARFMSWCKPVVASPLVVSSRLASDEVTLSELQALPTLKELFIGAPLRAAGAGLSGIRTLTKARSASIKPFHSKSDPSTH